jgi:hypothetical protein
MSASQLVVSLIQALAWPLVALVALVLFRRELSRLLARVEHLKAFSVEAQFGHQLVDLKQILQSTAAKQAEQPMGTLLVDQLGPVAKLAPATAVVDAYTRVEEALRERLARKGVTKVYQTSAPELVRLAAESNLLPPQTIQAFLGLSVLRNLAIHAGDTEVSPEKAMQYLALADGVLFDLKGGLSKEG